MNTARSKLQPPFRQRDLLALSDFIRYCKDRGVDASERQLEYYEKEELLLPAVRVNHGFIKHRNINGQTNYEYGAIGWDTDDWLDRYRRRGQVEYPAEAEFREWSTYKGVRPRKSRYFTEKPLPIYETFYSKYQMFPLKQVQDGLRISVRDQALFVDDADWLDIGKIRRMFAGAREVLQGKVIRGYETLALLNGILTLLDRMERSGQATYESSLEDWDKETERGKRKEASRDAWASIELEKSRKAREVAKALLAESGLSADLVAERRKEFAIRGHQADPIWSLFQHMKSIPREVRDRVSGTYRFACECYDVVDQLGWFLALLEREPTPLEEMLPGLSRYSLCPYCGGYFVRTRSVQTSCGADKCVKAHKNAWKREMRKKGLIE